MDETDEGLMLAVREGDITKLGSLFDRHHAVLYDYLIRMTRSRTTAEDLVQEVVPENSQIPPFTPTTALSDGCSAWHEMLESTCAGVVPSKRRCLTLL